MADLKRKRFIHATLAAIVLSFGTAAHAVVYKWVEDDGRVIYSNEPPNDPGKVREFTRIDDLDLVPADKRPALAAPAESSRSGESAAATTTTAPVTLVPREAPQRPSPELAIVKPAPVAQPTNAPVMLLGREPVTLLPKDPAAVAVEVEAPRRVIPRSTHTGAVQDPCLVSPDPRCHERNRDRYHPYLGYSPDGVAPAAAVGASAGAGAGGAVAGQVATQVSTSTPRRGAQALPPGSAPLVPITSPRTAR